MSEPRPASVDFVGLGVMGGRIARRLIRAGYQVHGYNRETTVERVKPRPST